MTDETLVPGPTSAGMPVTGSAWERPTSSILGIGYRLVIPADQTDGAYELMQFVVPKNHGPAPHVHHREDECFYVVDGEFEVSVGDQRIPAPAGTCIHLPRNVPHTFLNLSDSMSTFLCWVLPGQLAGFFAAFQRDWPTDQDQPDPVTEDDISRLMAAAAQHDIEILAGQ